MRTDAALAALLFAAIVIFRGRSLFMPFSDPTAGLYLHIGVAWLHGHIPYTTTWDYRPPGFFAMYAAAIAVFGPALARDALAIIALAATALAAGRIAVRIDARASRNTGWWAAAFFVMLSPVDDGIAGVAELQISAFIAWAIALVLAYPTSARAVALSGLLAGLALQCKFTAAPLVAIPLAIAAMRSGCALRSVLLFGAGFVAPVVADVVLYAQTHHLPALWNANVAGTLRRLRSVSSGNEFARNRVNFVRQLVALAPPIEFAAFALSANVNRSRIASAGWFLASVLSIVAAGEYYERQFVLLAAPVAILGAIGFTRLLALAGAAGVRRNLAIGVVLLTFGLHDYFETNQSIAFFVHRVVLRQRDWRADQFEKLATVLRCAPKGPGRLYLLEQSPYLYDALGDPAPTVYAYSDHLFDPRLSEMAGIDGAAELARVLHAHPAYVVVSSLDDYRYDPARVAELRTALARDYRLAYRVPEFSIYAATGATPAADARTTLCSPRV
jgi:hypothetical protein